VSTHVVLIVIDSNDPHSLARWWSEALGWPITLEDDEEVVVEPLDEREDLVPVLGFVPVPEAKTTKNRVHLDLASTSPEHQTATVERLLAAGATRADVGQTGDETWVVLADPEGNEFCVLRNNSDGGPLAAVCLDVVDDEAEAAFWVEASGWTIIEQDEEGTSLANPSGYRPHFDLLAVPDPSPGKNRIHIDVAPPKDADHAAEVDRLVAAGATPADVGQTGEESWVVLADPEGNELCVLSCRNIKALETESR
jgi:hypothetical protein